MRPATCKRTVSNKYFKNIVFLYKGTEVYICLTTLHGDGGAGVFFESFCFVGGKQKQQKKLRSYNFYVHITFLKMYFSKKKLFY